MEAKYNLRSPGVKRLMREAKELNQPTELYFAQPLEENLFEWHFTVRGPPDSDFAGGRYHGRITLPPEYPMKPPSIMLLTPNGRFEVGKKICLSMSAHHPETWQPSWSIRTVLMALIGFMPTPGAGAIGSLDYTTQERKVLAKKSLDWTCNGCDVCMKTILLETTGETLKEAEKEAAELAAQITFKGENEKVKPSGGSTATETATELGQQETETASSNSASNPPPGVYPWGINLPQYYAAYQSMYPYYAGSGYPMYNPMNSYPPSSQGYISYPAPVDNQNSVSSSQAQSVTTPSSQNAGNDSSSSNIRQRTTVSQTAMGQNNNIMPGAPVVENTSQSNSATVVDTQPRVTQGNILSLVVLWLLAVSIIALICRRVFVVS